MAGSIKAGSTPLLEWVAAGIGLFLILVLTWVIGREAIRGQISQPPSIEIQIGQITRSASGYVVTFEAVNRASGTAAELQVEGTLLAGKVEIEGSAATIDYVPGHGRASGGLFFSHDPRRYALAARATGFQDP
jgi:uncharacterized protein (TIGR02588 family)